MIYIIQQEGLYQNIVNYHYQDLRSTADDRGKSQNMKWYSPLIGCILKYQIYKLTLDLLFFNKLQHTTEWLVFVCCQKC